MSSGKRKSNTTSDFKRIKAKVGKKAKRQNDTDVSFRSASLHLGQSIEQDVESKKSGNPQLLVSSRGKSLYQLASTASTHPAAAARTSSLKGILDIVKKYPTEALLPNLSTLIPVCVHSCVDEDQDVRSIGNEALSFLLQQLTEKKIKPFGALLIARISSALHSLDASIRVNGVKMVNTLSITCPSLTIAFVNKLLPPFSGLLSDQRTKKSIDEILQSLISVLRVNSTRHADIPGKSPTFTSSNFGDRDVENTTKNDHQPDLFYFTGGRSRNTVLSAKRSVNVLPNGIESISHLSHPERHALNFSSKQNTVVNAIIRQGSRDNSLGIKLKTSLMSKLRDCLIESINLEHEPAMVPIKTRLLPTESQDNANYPRVISFLRAIRYISKSIEIYNAGIVDDDRIEFDKVAQQIVTVLIDIFPVDQDTTGISCAKGGKSASIDDVNAAIAMSILDISQNCDIDSRTVENNNMKDWIKTICSYVVPRIDHLRNDKGVTTSSSDLDLICKFLRRLGMDSYFSDDLSSVLDIVQDIFFCHNNTQIARSTEGRRVSMIMIELIDFSHYALVDESTDASKLSTSKIFHQFVAFIPFLLEAWGADFVYESRRLLEGLHRLIREVKGDHANALAESIRENWCKLVASRGDSASIFELYPWNLQKIYLGLMVLLEKPSDQSLKCLASICCRSTLKNDSLVRNEAIPQAIIEAIQKIRKSIPMQRYLSFLFQSIGISRHAKEVMSAEQDLDKFSEAVFEVAFFRADSHLTRVAKALVEPGSMRILRMILPQLSSWQQTEVADGTSSTEFLLKMRASLVILAYFFLQEKSKQGEQCEGQESIFDVTEGGITLHTLTSSICTFVRCVASKKERMNFHVPLTSPIVALMSSQDIILNEVMGNVNDLLREPGLSKLEQKNLESIMNEWMKDPRLKFSMTALSSQSKKK